MAVIAFAAMFTRTYRLLSRSYAEAAPAPAPPSASEPAPAD
jgi:hypothetical protein